MNDPDCCCEQELMALPIWILASLGSSRCNRRVELAKVYTMPNCAANAACYARTRPGWRGFPSNTISFLPIHSRRKPKGTHLRFHSLPFTDSAAFERPSTKSACSCQSSGGGVDATKLFDIGLAGGVLITAISGRHPRRNTISFARDHECNIDLRAGKQRITYHTALRVKGTGNGCNLIILVSEIRARA